MQTKIPFCSPDFFKLFTETECKEKLELLNMTQRRGGVEEKKRRVIFYSS